MLFGIIGATWVVSIMGGVLLLGYLNHLHHHYRFDEPLTDYVWDALRLLMVLCFAMALFYAGVALQLFHRPLTPLQQFFMAQTATAWTTLWTADRWAMLALGFVALGVVCALLQIDEVPRLRRPRFSLPRASLPKVSVPTISLPRISLPSSPFPNISIPERVRTRLQHPKQSRPNAETRAAARASAPPPAPRYTTHRTPSKVSAPPSQPFQFRWRRWVAATLAVGLTLFLWWGVGRIRFADLGNTGSLSSTPADDGLRAIFPNARARPTPTADTSSAVSAALVGERSAQDLPATEPVNAPLVIATDTPEVQTAAINTGSPQRNEGQPVDAQAAPTIPDTASVQAQPAVQPTIPTPVATIIPTERPLAIPLDVVISEAAGVNVRAEPGLSALILTVLSQGTRIPAIGRSLDSQWIRVRLDDGRAAWVAAFVVEVTGDPATLPLINAVNIDSAIAATASDAGIDTVTGSGSIGAREIQAAGAAPRRSSSLGSTSYSVDLLSPSEGASGNGLISFVWEANFTPAENQGLEVLFWEPGESALETGLRIAAPTSRGNAVVNLTDLNNAVNGAIAYGPYRWGIFLIQQSPYRRLALLSKERTFIFEQE